MSISIYEIKEKIRQNQKIVRNFSYLSILQIFNLLIPFLTYPYLIRVLGKETYGLVVFAQAIITYFTIIVSFGFNISGTRQISVNREDKEKLSEIVSSVLIIKSLLFFLSFLILSVLLIYIPRAHGFENLFFISMWSCLFDVIFPIWYFQGIEQMKYITYISLISRLIFFSLIFVFIHTPSDYLFFPLISGIGSLIAGCISLVIIFRNHKIQFKWQPIQTLKHYFTDSIPIFISNVSISIYVSTNKVITGAFLGMSEVAYYDLAEKLTSILRVPQSLLSQSLFPKISKDKNVSFVKKIFKLSMIINIVLYLLLLVFSKHIILLLGGENMLSAMLVVNILALTVPITAMSNIFGIQLLIPFGENKTFSKIILTSGLVYLLQLFILWLTTGFSIINISIIIVNTEIFVSAYMYYCCKKLNLWK